MASRNVLRVDIADSFYHVYDRGASKSKIFLEDEDYTVFLNLLKRYLSPDEVHDSSGRVYANFYDSVELLAFCLMPNHFHLMVYQVDEGALSNLMHSVMASYSRYFNNKYDRSGPLFESRYKASRVSGDSYLFHISRYIHLNPKDWRHWPWSSLPYYLDSLDAGWVRPERVLELFKDRQAYLSFVEDYEDHKDHLKLIKAQLADS